MNSKQTHICSSCRDGTVNHSDTLSLCGLYFNHSIVIDHSMEETVRTLLQKQDSPEGPKVDPLDLMKAYKVCKVWHVLDGMLKSCLIYYEKKQNAILIINKLWFVYI